MLQSNYFKSKDIKVFPSSFRGNYATTNTIDGTTFVFDPESRLNTEANFIAPGFTPNHPSYIVDYDKEGLSYIKFVLGGYYFELYNASEYATTLELKNKSIGITLREVPLSENNSIDSDRKTSVLNSWIAKTATPGSEQATDYILDTEEDEISYFVGLRILEDGEIADYIITLLDSNGEINQVELLANIDHGSGENTLTHGENLKADYSNQTVFGKYNANNPNSIFEIGNGTEGNRSNALEISPNTTTINTNTNITGALEVAGEVVINNTLNITGKTDIYSNVTVDSDKTTLGKPVEITDTTDNALIVKGKTTIKKDLEIGEDVKVLAVKNSPNAGEQNVTITGTLKSTSKATFENGLEVSSGETTLGGTVKISEKATSASTIPTDGDTILTTKDYVDAQCKAVSDFIKSDEIKRLMCNAIYPIGSIYMTMKADDPADLFGGGWQQISKGRVLLGAGGGIDEANKPAVFNATDLDGNPVMGGYYNPQPWAHWHKYSKARYVTEGTALKEEHMPRHTHTAWTTSAGYHSHGLKLTGTKHDRSNINNNDCIRVAATTDGAEITYAAKTLESPNNGIVIGAAAGHSHPVHLKFTGGTNGVEASGNGKTHTHDISLTNNTTNTTGYYISSTANKDGGTQTNGNLPPYLVCYIWQRVK